LGIKKDAVNQSVFGRLGTDLLIVLNLLRLEPFLRMILVPILERDL